MFTIFLIGGFGLTLLYPKIKIIYESGLLVYGLSLLMALKDIAKKEGFLIAALSTPFTFFTHLWYGIRFIQGLGNREYKASLRR
tara:strand:- start:139 stop:390 length:252 start_codon:yes stop_codon:yes gene_type:complete